MCLEKCQNVRLSLNPAKCAIRVTSGTLLGHILSKEGIVVDPSKVREILARAAPRNAKALG